MSEPIRCPSCGGLNPAGAQWCGQCLTRFEPEPQAPPPPPQPPAVSDPAAAPVETADPVPEQAGASVGDTSTQEAPSASDAAAPAATPAPAAPASKPIPKEAIGLTRGAFKVTGAGVLWSCSVCDTENTLDKTICVVCGSPFAETLREPDAKRPDRDPGTTALVSMFFPGAGHAYLGMWGQAIARGILSVWVIVVVIATALQGGSRVIPILFGFIAFALWLVAAHDSYREANDEASMILLRPKYFLYLVLGLLMLLFSLIFAGLLTARGGS